MIELTMMCAIVIAFCVGLYIGKRQEADTFARGKEEQKNNAVCEKHCEKHEAELVSSYAPPPQPEQVLEDALFEEDGADSFGFAVQIFGDAENRQQALRLIFNALNGWNKQLSEQTDEWCPPESLNFLSASGVRVSGSGKALKQKQRRVNGRIIWGSDD